MRWSNVSLNLFFLATAPLALWLGITGRADWWVILLIFLANCEFTVKLRR